MMSNPDPIFAAIGEYQARQAVACHTRCATADAAQARAEAAMLSTRATTPDGLHAGMCFRIGAVALHLHEAEHDAADLMWRVLSRAAARQPVATALDAMADILEPGFFTDLLRAALRDALELEAGAGVNAPAARRRTSHRRGGIDFRSPSKRRGEALGDGP